MTYKNSIRFLLYVNLTYNIEELKGTNELWTFHFPAGGCLSSRTIYRYTTNILDTCFVGSLNHSIYIILIFLYIQ